LDEEYVACFLECVVAGSVQNAMNSRPKVAKILGRKPPLAKRLELARTETADGVQWTPETGRIRNVVVKLARGHIAFEQNEPQLHSPARVTIIPLQLLTTQQLKDFEIGIGEGNTVSWPEVGSRAMLRLIEGGDDMDDYGWITVQSGLYRYNALSFGTVKIVLREYLIAVVNWD